MVWIQTKVYNTTTFCMLSCHNEKTVSSQVLLIGVPATALYIDFVVIWIQREFFPNVMDFATEVDYMINRDKCNDLMGVFANQVSIVFPQAFNSKLRALSIR